MIRRPILQILALAFCFSVIASASPSHANYQQAASTAAAGRPVLVVVDLSGSMNEPDENGKIKIQGAREAFTGLLSGLGGSTRLGVWTYPDDGSCGAGALTTRFSPVAGISADTTSGSWDAGGNTPTAQALRAAAKSVALAGGDTIILISDGESNCNADPCAAAADLAAEGINVEIHTVGFDISDQGNAELQCISSTTGGTHTNVENSDELVEALAALSEISLTVDLTDEVLDDAANTLFPSALVEVSATVANTGIRSARDLDLTLRFESERRPALIDGTRILPLLDGGSDHTARWNFGAPIECEDYVLEYRAIARIGGVQVAVDSGSTTISGRSDSVYCLLTSDGNLAILGDSYSSGEGAPPFDDGTNEGWNRCRRGQTYGRADRVDDPPVVLACSGAIIHDLLLPHGVHRVNSDDTAPLLPSQLQQLQDLPDGIEVVVLTISGNDIGFADIIKDCVVGSSCSDSASKSRKTTDIVFLEPEESPLPPTSPLQAPLMRALRIIDSTVNSDRERPVQFVLMAYPNLLPDNGESSKDSVACRIGGVLIDTDEVNYLAELPKRLKEVLEASTRDLQLEGRPFHFASSVANAFAGHTLCDDDPWGHGIEAIEQLGTIAARRPGGNFHPNGEGYRAMWRSLVAEARAEKWPLTARNVSVEMPVDGGKICPSDEVGDYRTLSYDDFLAESRLELRRGECIVVVGGPGDDRPPGGNVNWSIDRLAVPSLSDSIDDDSTTTEEDYVLRSWIAFYIHSEPELLGVAAPDKNGTFQEILWIPDDLPTGRHTLSAYVQDGTGSIEMLSRPVVLVDEQTAPYKAVLGLALATALIGVGILILVPRRSTIEDRRNGASPPTAR